MYKFIWTTTLPANIPEAVAAIYDGSMTYYALVNNTTKAIDVIADFRRMIDADQNLKCVLIILDSRGVVSQEKSFQVLPQPSRSDWV